MDMDQQGVAGALRSCEGSGMETTNQGAACVQGRTAQPELPRPNVPDDDILRQAYEELCRLDREQLVELTVTLLEAMPSSYRWSVVASIRHEKRRRPPARQPRMQSP